MTVTVAAAGVDTWSPCWHVAPGSIAGRWLSSMATAKTARGALVPEPVAGHRVGWIEGVGMLYAEGHPAGALGAEGLLRPDRLPAAYEGLVSALLEADVPVPSGRSSEGLYGDLHDGAAGIRRCDATVDVATASVSEGRAILSGVAAVLREQGHAQIRADRLGVQTAYLHGRDGKKVLGRWYDKGLESGLAERFRLIRPEDQRRYVKSSRRGVEELTAEYVRSKFQQRFVNLWRASEGVKVVSERRYIEEVVNLIEGGRLSAAQGESMLGHMLIRRELAGRLNLLGPEDVHPEDLVRRLHVHRATAYRRSALARDVGLLLADDADGPEDVEVDLHDVMERVLDRGAWGAGDGA